jgi:hypothetical protein
LQQQVLQLLAEAAAPACQHQDHQGPDVAAEQLYAAVDGLWGSIRRCACGQSQLGGAARAPTQSQQAQSAARTACCCRAVAARCWA